MVHSHRGNGRSVGMRAGKAVVKRRRSGAANNKRRVSRGTALAGDWTPSQAEIIYGINLGFEEFEILGFAEDMRLWALSNSHRAVARKANWSTTFMGWLRREAAKRNPIRRLGGRSITNVVDVIEELEDGERGSATKSWADDLFAAIESPSGRHH